MGKAENSWTVETWNPIRPDGTIDEAELRRPVETPEPTKWEVAIPAFGARQSAVVIEILWAARLCPRHRFWVLTAQLKTLPEEWPENVTLAVGPLHTQAEADAAIPALLAVKAARREVVFAPTEAIDLAPYWSPRAADICMLGATFIRVTDFKWSDHGALLCPECGHPGEAVDMGLSDGGSIHAVRVRGGAPEYVASLREQCRSAGVKFVEEPEVR